LVAVLKSPLAAVPLFVSAQLVEVSTRGSSIAPFKRGGVAGASKACGSLTKVAKLLWMDLVVKAFLQLARLGREDTDLTAGAT
jgi:hypothetical protein